MKTTAHAMLLLLIALTGGNLFAQIPNSGFENWNNTGSYLAPEGWWTTNDSATGAYYAMTRSTDHYPASVGNYSMRLENNIAVLPDWGGVGLAWTGGWEGNNYPAFPIVGHPLSLCGYYKFIPQNGDTMDVHIRLYKNGVDISGGQFKTAVTDSAWTPFILTFSTYAEADSARIMISSCYDNDAPSPHGNSVLYIDNLNFDSLLTSGVSGIDAENNISLYPNPTSGALTISFAENAGNQIDLEIINQSGQQVFTQNISGNETQITLRLSQFAEGIYFVRMFSCSQVLYSKKIIIAR